MKRTNLIDWMFDDGEWLSWTLSLLVPGIIVAVLLIPGLIILGALLLIFGVIDFITKTLEEKNDEQSIVKASDEKKKDSPRLVRGVLIDNNEYDKSFNLKRCIPVIMIRTDKLDKYTISNDTEVITVSDTYEHHLITFMVCDESLYSILKVPGKFLYNDDLGVILGFGNKEIDKFVEKLKTPIITV